MKIDDNKIMIVNKKIKRKRLVNIYYLIKKILQEMGCEKYQLVYLKTSIDTFSIYERWWKIYKSIE